MKMQIRAILVIFFFTVRLFANDDELKFSHLTAEDGLSLNVITQIIQDSRGFLWIGTVNGLNRYDGYNFKLFLPDPSNSKSISSHSIRSIIEDSKGFIWIGTDNGLNKYDFRTDEFYKYKANRKEHNSLSKNSVYSIFLDKEGVVWIGTSNGLNRYNRKDDNFTVIKKVNEKLNPDSLNSVSCIAEDHAENLWLGTWNGLTCMRKDGKIIKQFLHEDSNTKTIASNHITTLFVDDDDNVWIGSDQGLDKYNIQTGAITHYISKLKKTGTISDNYLNTIFQDKAKNIWVGTKNGLNEFEPKSDDFKRIMHDPLKPLSIINNEINCLTQDNTGIIWIGTSGGISWFFNPLNKFNSYHEDKLNPSKSLNSNFVTSVFSNKEGNIWVGTVEGLNEIDKAGSRIIDYSHFSNDTNSLSNKYVMSVIEDHTGLIWIGTNGGGLNCYNPSTGNYKTYLHNEHDIYSLSNNGVVSIFEDREGYIWIGTWWGLNRFDKKTGKFLRYLPNTQNPHSIRHTIVWVIFEDSRNMLWFGTDGGGVSEFNPVTSTFTNFYRDSSATGNNISGNRVISLFESNDGNMWFGTTEGLSEYSPGTGKFKIYNEKSGLLGILINGIQEDKKGNLWISTEKGLAKLDRKTGRFYCFTQRSGLYTMEFTPNASGKSKDGLLYFGSRDGLIYFNPDEIKTENLSVPIVFSDLKIYNQSVPITTDGILHESISSTNVIKIPQSSVVITLEFTLLDYFNIKGNNFSYKLNGFDADWNNIGNRNTATYTNLPPGIYNLFVKATNNDGVTSKNDASLQIIILPAFYQTWWFKIVLGLGLTLITILVIQVRTHQVQKQNKILESRVAEHTKDLKERSGELEKINVVLQGEIKERLLAENTLKQYNSRLEVFDKIYRKIISAKSVDEIIEETLIRLPILFNFIDAAGIALFDLKTDKVIVNFANFDKKPEISFSKIELPIDHCVINNRNTILSTTYFINDIRQVEKKLPIDQQLYTRGFLSYLASPLEADNNWFGNLIVSARTANNFNDSHKEILLIISNQLSAAIYQAQLQEKIKAHSQNLQNSLSENEVLLKEIHHRVKNNLQIISSLLYLNSKKIKDKEALNMFTDSRNRVKSIALVHERLYRSKNLGKIDFNEYVQHLTADLFRSYAVNQSLIKLDININSIFIDIDFAVPCGLIINELISNSLKYAFPNYEEKNQEGIIKINFNRNGTDELLLLVSDNGIGMPDGIDEKKKHSLGLQLVDTLVTQLEGILKINSGLGTEFIIKFNKL